MMAANYRHIGGGVNRLGRHYSRFSGFWPMASVVDQSLALRKSQNRESNRRRRAIGDALDDEPGSLVQGGGDMRLLIAVASAVGLRQVPAQRISQKARRVQYNKSPPQ